jgi:hypothetical protein
MRVQAHKERLKQEYLLKKEAEEQEQAKQMAVIRARKEIEAEERESKREAVVEAAQSRLDELVFDFKWG